MNAKNGAAQARRGIIGARIYIVSAPGSSDGTATLRIALSNYFFAKITTWLQQCLLGIFNGEAAMTTS